MRWIGGCSDILEKVLSWKWDKKVCLDLNMWERYNCDFTQLREALLFVTAPAWEDFCKRINIKKINSPWVLNFERGSTRSTCPSWPVRPNGPVWNHTDPLCTLSLTVIRRILLGLNKNTIHYNSGEICCFQCLIPHSTDSSFKRSYNHVKGVTHSDEPTGNHHLTLQFPSTLQTFITTFSS